MIPNTIYTGDCRDTLSQWPDACIDSIVTDPPYGLSFMGKDWDHGVPGVEFWRHALRIAKPGAHLLAFGGTRTYHRLACAIEDAGWEVRDCVMWVYGSGFPKSADVSKMLDKHEQKQWLDIVKAIDNKPQFAIMEAWKEHSKTAIDAGLLFAKSETGTGTSTRKSGFAPASVLLQANPENGDAVALVAELSLTEAHRTSGATCNSAQSPAESSTTESKSLATSAASPPESLVAMLGIPDSSALQSAWGWQGESTADKLKAVEAMKTWLGSKPSSRQADTSALCAALTADLKLITLSQSKTFQSFDTTRQTACAYAISATITESTAESLISFTVDTLRSKAIDKAAGAEREVVGVAGKSGSVRNSMAGDFAGGEYVSTAPATDAARQWHGWGTSLKPSFEPVIWATKPLRNLGDCAIIIQNLTQMEAELCKRIANVAARSSQHTPPGSSAAKVDSVQTPAPIQAGVAVGNETGTGAAGATNLEAAISGSTLEAENIALNTISLWRRTLEDALNLANTCTTETASSLTTDLKIWSLSLSQITLDNIILAASHPNGLSAPVSNAAQYFSVISAKSNAIHELIAQGIVTGSSEIHPAWEPIIVARKPLIGTVAENVIQYGTGGINVDGCRIETGDNLNGGVYSGGTSKTMFSGLGRLQPGDYVQPAGRWPANLILSYPEDEYELRDDVTPEQLRQLAGWLDANG